MLPDQSNPQLHYPVHDVERYIRTLSCFMHARGYQSLAFLQEVGYYDTPCAHHFSAY